MNPEQKLALLRDLLVASEVERDAVLKAKQQHIDTLRQRVDQIMSFNKPADTSDINEVKP